MRTKRIVVVGALAAVLALGLSPRPARAHHGHHHHHRHGHGHFWGGFGGGFGAGLLLGTLAAPRYYYAPAPVYVAPPACRDFYTPGYWQQIRVDNPDGTTIYRNEWVPGSTQRVCQ